VSLRGSSEGEPVLALAVQEAQRRWGQHLLAGYALGSLAHGGFSPLVSDVDLGLVFADPLRVEDAREVDELARTVKGSGLPLAGRLSVFWGSLESLRGGRSGGRFPPVDRLDLIKHGRLLVGKDIRAGLPPPTQHELIVEGATFALHMLATSEITAQLLSPQGLLEEGARHLTKLVLFPARFLYTAWTGEIGQNDVAVEYVAGTESGSISALLRQALLWRTQPLSGEAGAMALLRAGLVPLYLRFIDEYRHLLSAGAPEIAERLQRWRSHLSPCSE
jgi:hypothetical protein